MSKKKRILDSSKDLLLWFCSKNPPVFLPNHYIIISGTNHNLNKDNPSLPVLIKPSRARQGEK